jgi:hypothetical protein
MFLTYANGSRTEAFLLARTENKIRVAIPGSDDPLELTDIRGTWVTEDCEPVRVEFAWEKKTREQILTEADCICSHDLAARLIHLLWNGDEEDTTQSKQTILPGNIESLAPVSFRN